MSTTKFIQIIFVKPHFSVTMNKGQSSMSLGNKSRNSTYVILIGLYIDIYIYTWEGDG